MGFKQKQRRDRRVKFFETLEGRQLLSTVNITPGGNWLAAVSASNPGDTVSFAPGTYSLASNSVPRLPSGRNFVGNGAVISSDGSAYLDLGYSTNTTFSGFTLNGVNAKADFANGLKFTNNTVENGGSEGFLTTGMYNSSVSNNTFLNESQGIYGYPGNNTVTDNNRFDYVGEPIHYSCSSPSSGMDVSGNMITHATRIGIELQRCISNLTVNNNYFSDWLQQGTGGSDWHMGISCTTGGNGAAPYNDQGQNITISNNTFLQTGPAQNIQVWAKSAIEIMGAGSINIANNYSYDWGNLILNGAMAKVNSSNNTVINGFVSSPDNVPWAIGGTNSSGDKTYSLNSYPPFPAAPTNTGAGSNASVVVVPPTSGGSTNATGGTLTGTSAAAASGYNLTQIGTTDWAAWGVGNNASVTDRKASGNSQISNLTSVGSGSYGSYYNSTRSVSWTDGSPQSSNSGENGYMWANNAIGAGYKFTVPASTSQQTVYVYCGGYSSGATLTATLSDGSSPVFTANASGSGIYSNIYAITFSAASAGQTLTVSYTKTSNINGTSGSVDMIAAGLASGANGVPSGSSNTGSSNTGSTNTGSTGATGGALSGAQNAAATSYNLTSLGTTDWAHWGTGNNASAFTHKASGNTQISNVTKLGSGSYGAYYNSSRSVSWTDGTPATSNGGDNSYIWANNAIGAGYSFTVPASTTQHTIYVIVGGYSAGGTLTATLSDGSAAPYTATVSGNGTFTYTYAITYKAASANQTLTISYAKSSNINGTSGSVDLIAAALQ